MYADSCSLSNAGSRCCRQVPGRCKGSLALLLQEFAVLIMPMNRFTLYILPRFFLQPVQHRSLLKRQWDPASVLADIETTANTAINRTRSKGYSGFERCNGDDSQQERLYARPCHLHRWPHRAVAAGAPGEVSGARVYDLKGSFVTPGIVDTHSHLGVCPYT